MFLLQNMRHKVYKVKGKESPFLLSKSTAREINVKFLKLKRP